MCKSEKYLFILIKLFLKSFGVDFYVRFVNNGFFVFVFFNFVRKCYYSGFKCWYFVIVNDWINE